MKLAAITEADGPAPCSKCGEMIRRPVLRTKSDGTKETKFVCADCHGGESPAQPEARTRDRGAFADNRYHGDGRPHGGEW